MKTLPQLDPNLAMILATQLQQRIGMGGQMMLPQFTGGQGLDPNLGAMLVANGQLPSRQNMQGQYMLPNAGPPRSALDNQQFSGLDSYWATQRNPGGQSRYSNPTFNMGPARVAQDNTTDAERSHMARDRTAFASNPEAFKSQTAQLGQRLSKPQATAKPAQRPTPQPNIPWQGPPQLPSASPRPNKFVQRNIMSGLDTVDNVFGKMKIQQDYQQKIDSLKPSTDAAQQFMYDLYQGGNLDKDLQPGSGLPDSINPELLGRMQQMYPGLLEQRLAQPETGNSLRRQVVGGLLRFLPDGSQAGVNNYFPNSMQSPQPFDYDYEKLRRDAVPPPPLQLMPKWWNTSWMGR